MFLLVFFCFVFFVCPLFITAPSKSRFYNFELLGDKSLEVKATGPPASSSSMLSTVITINNIRTKTRIKLIQNEENGIRWIEMNYLILNVTEKY